MSVKRIFTKRNGINELWDLVSPRQYKVDFCESKSVLEGFIANVSGIVKGVCRGALFGASSMAVFGADGFGMLKGAVVGAVVDGGLNVLSELELYSWKKTKPEYYREHIKSGYDRIV